VVQWLRDGLGIINTSAEIESLAAQAEDNGDVFFVPTFTGMGAPYWDQYARGLMVGLTRGTTRANIARAALEGIAYQTMDVIGAMESDTGMQITELRVDGGASANNLLMQFQSDILNVPVIRPQVVETTALGAAYLAGLATGFWKDINELRQQWQLERKFKSTMQFDKRDELKSKWGNAVQRAKGWSE
jgi:glycerol kinase